MMTSIKLQLLFGDMFENMNTKKHPQLEATVTVHFNSISVLSRHITFMTFTHLTFSCSNYVNSMTICPFLSTKIKHQNMHCCTDFLRTFPDLGYENTIFTTFSGHKNHALSTQHENRITYLVLRVTLIAWTQCHGYKCCTNEFPGWETSTST